MAADILLKPELAREVEDSGAALGSDSSSSSFLFAANRALHQRAAQPCITSIHSLPHLCSFDEMLLAEIS